MAYIFRDSLENIRETPYYEFLKDNVITSLGEKGLKKKYLIENGYRNQFDEKNERDYISEEQFAILLKIEQTYHDDFLRLGCERFWDGRLSDKERNYYNKVKNKRKQMAPFFM